MSRPIRSPRQDSGTHTDVGPPPTHRRAASSRHSRAGRPLTNLLPIAGGAVAERLRGSCRNGYQIGPGGAAPPPSTFGTSPCWGRKGIMQRSPQAGIHSVMWSSRAPRFECQVSTTRLRNANGRRSGWIPACAGMTGRGGTTERGGNDGMWAGLTEWCGNHEKRRV